MIEEIEAAIYCISPEDRDTWVRMAMAVKAGCGEAGFPVWDAWSRQSGRYREADARSVWRSVKAGGGITERTLFREARDAGWTGTEPVAPARPARDWRAERRERERIEAGYARAAERAAAIVEACRIDTHVYLARKGFPEEQGLIDETGALIIPMRSVTDYRHIQSVQRIEGADGAKKFLTGGRAKGAVFFIGAGLENWLCEGYATGLSIKRALDLMHRPARVVVCFSAANTRHVARILQNCRIVADHDASGTGEHYARAAGCPWITLGEVGMDANDYERAHGIFALANELRALFSY